MAIIKTLKTTTNDVEQSVYPKTVLEAVVDTDTNQTLDVILDNIKSDTPNGSAYVDFNEQSGEVTGEVEAVTSAKLVSYSNTESGIEATNVQEAIDEVNEKTDDINTYLQRGCRNLLKVTAVTGSVGSGCSWIVNEDKTITLNGTQSGFTIGTATIGKAYLKANTEYILSGCPEGGSTSTYYLSIQDKGTYYHDTGEGVTFTPSADGEYQIGIGLIMDITHDNELYKPMIREASIEDDTYEPYRQDAMSIVNNALVHGDVVDGLYSSATDLPLSANQGRVLNNKLTNMANITTGSLIPNKPEKFILPRGILSALLLINLEEGPNGYGMYLLTYKSTRECCKLIENINGASYTITSDTSGVTVTPAYIGTYTLIYNSINIA